MKYEIGDKVWVMEQNRPICRQIAIIAERFIIGGKGVTTTYFQLLLSICTPDEFGYSVSKKYNIDQIFPTKNDLLDSFRP